MKCVAAVLAFSVIATASSVPVAKPKVKHSTTKRPSAVGSVQPSASKHGSKAATPRGRSRGRTRAAGPSYQTHPDPERYQQIQQALAEKGYYKGEVNGQWNDDSTDALKRFQADRQLESDGRINALTLRDLGLGPKHDGSSAPLSGARPTSTPADKATETPIEPPPMPTEPPASEAPPE